MVRTPAISHDSKSQPELPSWRDMSAETMKIAEPIMDPATIMVLSNSPSPRLKPWTLTSCRSVASLRSDVSFLPRATPPLKASRPVNTAMPRGPTNHADDRPLSMPLTGFFEDRLSKCSERPFSLLPGSRGFPLHGVQQTIQISARKVAAVEHHAANLARVADRIQRVRIQQHQVRTLALLDRPGIGESQILARIARRRLQSFQRRQAGARQKLQLTMQAESRIDTHSRRSVRARQNGHARAVHLAHHPEFRLHERFALRHRIGGPAFQNVARKHRPCALPPGSRRILQQRIGPRVCLLDQPFALFPIKRRHLPGPIP